MRFLGVGPGRGLALGPGIGLLIGLALGLGACAAAPDRGPERPVAETHVCTQSPDGLAECREIEARP